MSCHRRTEQSLAADGAIACFSNNFFPFSLNGDRAPQLKASVRCLLESKEGSHSFMELWASPDGVNLGERFQLKKLKYTKYNLSSEQKRLLRKQGHKYYQLMDGSIPPLSAKQKHFVDMCLNLVEPQDEWEQIWKSYLFTLEEEKRLDAVYRAELRQSPRTEERLKRLWLSGGRSLPAEAANPPRTAPLSEKPSRECRLCRGSGMRGDGDNCSRCDGRGWIETK